MEFLAEAETWVALGFVIVIGIFLWQKVPALVGKMLDQRAAVISKELDEARRLREDAASLLADYKRKAANAETEAAAIVADARIEAERFAAESKAALTAQIERRVQITQQKIEQAEAAALAEIRATAADAATAAAEKLIAAKMDEKRSAALVADSIKNLSAKLN